MTTHSRLPPIGRPVRMLGKELTPTTHRQKDHAMLGKHCCDRKRMLACALAVGALFAALAGFQAGQSAKGDSPTTKSSVQLGFAPAPAVFGLLAGALAGVVVGFAWTRRPVNEQSPPITPRAGPRVA